MIDAHVHIERGPYHREWLGRFIEHAIQNQITELYFLEHSHRFIEFRPAYESVIRYNEYQKNWYLGRSCLSIQSYLDFVEEMKKVEHPIQIRWGLEICYLPGVEKIVCESELRNSFDFLTGSIHWIDGWGFDHHKDHWSGRNVDQVYTRYFELEKELIETRLFDHLAHPDAIKCFNHCPSFNLEKMYLSVAEAAKTSQIKVEQSCGLRNNYGHPELGMNPLFLRILKACGIPLITASDAHCPEDVGKNILQAERLMAELP